ncbi:YkuS family protein [Bacillus tianshenii]|nr:YkuS family protein [Bacillus tianshenii]
MPRIGVEQSLSDIQQALQEKGYEITQLKQEQDVNGCDCCVITGQDENVMGISTAAFEGAVIEARGLTAEQVCQEVEQRIGRQ